MDDRKDFRDAIVHGDGMIYVSDQGDWLWDCQYLKARDPEPHREPFRMAEAAKFEAELEDRVRSVCAGLSNYRPK